MACIGAHQRKELERPCRTITRPAIANQRLSRNEKGQVLLQLKSPRRGHDAQIDRILTHLGLPARAAPRSPARAPALFQAA